MLRVVKSSGPLALLRRNEWVWVRIGHISKHFAWHLSYEAQSCICAKMRLQQTQNFQLLLLRNSEMLVRKDPSLLKSTKRTSITVDDWRAVRW